MMTAKRIILGLSLGLLAVAPAAMAQSEAEFSDRKLENYVAAQQQVREINQDYSERLQDVQSRDKAVELQNQARQEMIEAIQSVGLSVGEYNEITQAMRTDPEFYERVQELR